MTIDEIKKLIQNGEKIDVEFKESRNALTKDVFDTVCSFNNRNGGHILLGVNDKEILLVLVKIKWIRLLKNLQHLSTIRRRCTHHFIYYRKYLRLTVKSHLYPSA